MNVEQISLEALKKGTILPKVVNDQVEELHFTDYGERTIGVGLFLADSERCVLAMIGENLEESTVLGHYGTSDEHSKLILHGLRIAFEAYLRSVHGDQVIGKLNIKH